ncbi:TATA-box binding -interacting TOUGH isoform B [Micractinium conductrix]|uniref:TATA-box binding -interacting TOUGH isoform B n=1 Tax=Micractinium conductrix TaxID=554055 RepID=A0A2P6V4F7_9CHLO|nr:TATA-box binding -interacting TOUGH isoform B [Micractinium conductrix]|eukprot:PSC68980.1 TATA-box binding -interacting TOUGH isoform B [Micractinium conductrix]
MEAGSDEEDFQFFGTPIEDEVETRVAQHSKKVTDVQATRALPLHKQEVTDEQGRRRFHGAFTGGYSAGYYNTVGSAEGWQPSTFRSSRDSRAAVQQSVEQFLDEDELEDLRRTNLQTTEQYDTFGSTAAELARRAAADAAAERPSAIPGLLPEEMVAPVADSVGIRLLQKMGWRQGKGIGVGGDAPTAADDAAEDEAGAGGGGGGGGRRRRWGQHVSVAADNTSLYLLAPKTDVHGLGFDPFKGAEDFRALKEAARGKAAPKAPEPAAKRRRGIAFGQGVLDEDDAFGTLEDYVTHDDVEGYEETVETDGMPRQRGPTVQKSGLGDRLAARGFSFEIVEEEEEEQGLLSWHPAHPKRQQQYALPGRQAPLLLQSREQQVKNSLIPGFVRATLTVTLTYFPPPTVPPGYLPLHRARPAVDAALPAAASKFAPPQADPPPDAELRQAIDSLAFFVARNGVVFENMARQRQQKEARWSFLSGGEGAPYYRWKVHSLRALVQPQQQQQQQRRGQRPIGQRSAPLSADERGALLGEQPLAASAASSWAAGAAGHAAAGRDAAQQAQQQGLRRQLMQVAEADRSRLQQLLSRNFVAAESQDMLHPGAEAETMSGLRPGAPAPAPRVPAGAAGAASAGAKVVTTADFARPTDDAGGGGLALRAIGAAAAPGSEAPARRLPVRRSEEWRPVALLCKRFNVPDPYHGRPAELQMSRFKTDHLVLPDTAAAVAASLNSVPAGAQDFLLPPTVAAALAEAEAKQLLALEQGSAAAAAQPQQQAQQAQQAAPQDASGAANAFLSSLSDMLGGPSEAAAPDGGAEPAPPLPAEPPPEEAAPAAEAERPVDLFKAIFEDSEEEDEEEAADATAHAQQPEQQLGGGAAARPPPQQHHGGLTLVDDELARPGGYQQPPAAQHAQRAWQQPQQAQRDDDAFGFAKLRAQVPPAGPVAAAAAAGAAVGASIDDATKQRVQEALRALKKDKKEKKGKRSSRKKEKKEKEKKKGGKEKGRKRHRTDDGRSKHKRRRGSASGGSSSSSGSGSE